MAKEVKHFCMYLLVNSPSFETCMFRSFDYLLNGLFNFLVFSFLNFIYILNINLLSDDELAKFVPIL
jgi:hypothetical protein